MTQKFSKKGKLGEAGGGTHARDTLEGSHQGLTEERSPQETFQLIGKGSYVANPHFNNADRETSYLAPDFQLQNATYSI